MRWLRLLLALSLIGDALLIFQCLLALVLMGGRLILLALRSVSRSAPACWFDTPDWSSSSVARVVQDAWDVYRDELAAVPPDVVLALRDAVSMSSVDDFWIIWSKSAEAGLFGAYCGGRTEAGSSAFLGRGQLRIRSGRLGGRAVGRSGASRLYRVSQSDEVDVQSAQYFVNSSLAPVLLFRRRLKSVADVLKGIRNHGFTQVGGIAEVLACCLSSWSM